MAVLQVAALRSLGGGLVVGDVRIRLLGSPRFEIDGEPLTEVADLGPAMEDADLVILLQPHRAIMEADEFARATMILDTRGVLEGTNVERL